MPDRLPSRPCRLLDSSGGGWLDCGRALHRSTKRDRATVTYAAMAIFVLVYAAAWFLFNLGRMPPYIPGASTNPRFAPPGAVAGLAIVESALVLPGSALACVLAFRRRGRMLSSESTPRAPA